MKILFAVRSLDTGGAQRQLVATARGLHARGHDVSVAVFYGGGLFEADLRADGIEVHDLRRTSRWESGRFMARMARLVWRKRPDVLYAYMGEANLFSALLKPAFPPLKLIWGIRDALPDLTAYGRLSVAMGAVSGTFSNFADAIITNSQAARARSIARGIDARKILVVPNGIDCTVFRPQRSQALELRREWNIPESSKIVGMVARLDPVKGHETFLRAAAILAPTTPGARFVCVGDGKPDHRERLLRLAKRLGLGDRVLWAGERRVTPAVYSAFDVAVLSSNVGESFPNVVAEAMACATPCVATDSGDIRSLVGDTGVVVPPGDAEALASAVGQLLRRDHGQDPLGERARSRIEREFSVARLVGRTEEALEAVMTRLPVRVLARPRRDEVSLSDGGGHVIA